MRNVLIAACVVSLGVLSASALCTYAHVQPLEYPYAGQVGRFARADVQPGGAPRGIGGLIRDGFSKATSLWCSSGMATRVGVCVAAAATVYGTYRFVRWLVRPSDQKFTDRFEQLLTRIEGLYDPVALRLDQTYDEHVSVSVMVAAAPAEDLLHDLAVGKAVPFQQFMSDLTTYTKKLSQQARSLDARIRGLPRLARRNATQAALGARMSAARDRARNMLPRLVRLREYMSAHRAYFCLWDSAQETRDAWAEAGMRYRTSLNLIGARRGGNKESAERFMCTSDEELLALLAQAQVPFAAAAYRQQLERSMTTLATCRTRLTNLIMGPSAVPYARGEFIPIDQNARALLAELEVFRAYIVRHEPYFGLYREYERVSRAYGTSPEPVNPGGDSRYPLLTYLEALNRDLQKLQWAVPTNCGSYPIMRIQALTLLGCLSRRCNLMKSDTRYAQELRDRERERQYNELIAAQRRLADEQARTAAAQEHANTLREREQRLLRERLAGRSSHTTGIVILS